MSAKAGFLRGFAGAAGLAAAALLAACTHDQRTAAAVPGPAQVVPPTPAQTAEASTPGFGFFYAEEGGDVKLAYGEPNSDNVGLMLECAKGSRVVRVSGAAPAGPAPVLTLTSAGATTELKAVLDAGEGMPVLTASAPLASPVLVAFRRSGRIEIAYGGSRYAVAAKPQEQAALDRFFTACDGRPA